MKKKKYAVFTVDVETFSDTECVSYSGEPVDVDLLDGLEEYISVLDRHGIKSTMFTVGTLAPQIADRLRRHIHNGHRLALHNYAHIAPMDISTDKFREQVAEAKNMLSQMFGVSVEGFRAPCFSLDKERLDILRELGFRYDSSSIGFSKARHTVKLDLTDFQQCRTGIMRRDGFYEFELSRQNVFGQPFPISGGGYVRLGDWGFIKALISRYVRNNDYYVFYLHPFEMTREKIPFLKNLKGYDKYYLHAGIATYRKKLEWIISQLKKHDFEFVTFEELAGILDRQPAS